VAASTALGILMTLAMLSTLMVLLRRGAAAADSARLRPVASFTSFGVRAE
jgi:hypothetical protein